MSVCKCDKRIRYLAVYASSRESNFFMSPPRNYTLRLVYVVLRCAQNCYLSILYLAVYASSRESNFFMSPPRNYTLKFDNVLSPPTMKWDLRPCLEGPFYVVKKKILIS